MLKYLNFFVHYGFVIFFVWLSGIGIDRFTDFPAPSFGIHTFVIVYIIVFIHRQYVGGTINITEMFKTKSSTDKPEPILKDTNPLD